MNEFIFYDPQGNKLNKKEFIELYSNIYYYLNTDRKLEKRIEKIVDKDTLDSNDIIDILRWKVGATNFDYQKQIVKNQWRTINASELIEKLKGKKKQIDNPSCMLKDFMKTKGIGPTYAITILYFLSKGEYPIYDKFAHIALKVIDESYEYTKIIHSNELEKEFHSNSAKSDKIFDNYNKYIGRLNKIFGNEYKTNRNIDQVLWAYGHLFSDTKKNNNK